MNYNEIKGIHEVATLVGLNLPESANDFQRATLTLAHVMAALRESVLKGAVISDNIIVMVHDLALCMDKHGSEQK